MHEAGNFTQNRRAFYRRRLAGAAAIVLLCALALSARAAAPDWQFAPPRIGAALLEGGWSVERPLGVVSGSPEFSFPLQLVYLSTREQSGLLGDQWFIPQLESFLLPREQGRLLWQTPGGRQIALTSAKKAKIFRDNAGEWQAEEGRPGAFTVSNADGWKFTYKAGKLDTVTSPTGRLLEFSYDGAKPTAIVLRDPASGATRKLIELKYDRAGHVDKLAISGVVHQFRYEKGRDARLVGWLTPGGAYDLFEYAKESPLAAITHVVPSTTTPSAAQTPTLNTQPSALNKPAQDRLVLKTAFNPPTNAEGRATRPARAESDPANYRITDDGTYTYTYGEGGKSWKFWRQAPGREIAATSRAGLRQSYTLDEKQGLETWQTGGVVTRKFYHLAPGKPWNGKLRRVEQDGHIHAEYQYDQKTGNLIEARDRDGKTRYDYAAADPKSKFQTSKCLRVTREVAGKTQVVAAMDYDAAGRVVAFTDAAGRKTQIAYNERGQVSATTSPEGVRSEVAFDALGRAIGFHSSDTKGSAQVTFDVQGRVASRKMPDGQLAEFKYDEAGRVKEAFQNGVKVSSFTYDANGAAITTADALDRTTRLTRDVRGRVLSEAKPSGVTTRYEYDSLGRRTAQIDGKGNRIDFKYDPAGHLIEQKNPLNQLLTWTYNPRGCLVQRTNGVQKITYAYDDRDRLTLIDYGTVGPLRTDTKAERQSIAYTYDAYGRIATAATPTIAVAYTYDDQGRFLSQRMTSKTSDRLLKYTWNPRGQKTSVTLTDLRPSKPNGAAAVSNSQHSTLNSQPLLQQTRYHYDERGNLSQLESNGKIVCTYQYDKADLLIARRYGNGMIARYTYDNRNRQTSMILSDGPLGDPLKLIYKWDDAGQLLARAWNGETQLYKYDKAGQLLEVNAINHADLAKVAPAATASASGLSTINAQPSTLIESYQYDLAGNISEKFEHGLTTAMTYDPANQLATLSTSGTSGAISNQPSTINFGYDPAGRITERAAPESENHQSSIANHKSTYGYLDKLLRLDRSDATILYDYYPDGQLATKSVIPTNHDSPITSHAEDFIWDGLTLLYRNGTGYATEPHISGGIAVSKTKDGATSYVINDILGTAMAIVTDTQLKLASLTAFGRPTTWPAKNPQPEAPMLPGVSTQSATNTASAIDR